MPGILWMLAQVKGGVNLAGASDLTTACHTIAAKNISFTKVSEYTLSQQLSLK